MLPGSWVAFLLLLLLSEAISAISVLQPPVKRVAVEYDYDELNSVTTVAPGSTITTAIPIRCDYDTCVPQTTSCAEISFKTGCLCPGFTVWDKRPEAPWLREIILERSGQVVVHWCAPHSKVTHYKVTLKCGDEQQQIFGEHLRNATVPGLKVGETVCVSAVNEAGVSEESCAQYELQELDLKRIDVLLPSTITTAIPNRCDYDTCVPQTTSCYEISFKTGCLCPGFTGWDKRPEAPWLREIKLEQSGQVVVHWCAPHSKVTHYKVTLKCGDEQQNIFGEHLRNATVPGLKVGETVCVSAVNGAGVSEESCSQYEPPA
nr:LRRN4 C-terminal-like protein isoform X2 [Misgurnus anguillicaudatus]